MFTWCDCDSTANRQLIAKAKSQSRISLCEWTFRDENHKSCKNKDNGFISASSLFWLCISFEEWTLVYLLSGRTSVFSEIKKFRRYKKRSSEKRKPYGSLTRQDDNGKITSLSSSSSHMNTHIWSHRTQLSRPISECCGKVMFSVYLSFCSQRGDSIP